MSDVVEYEFTKLAKFVARRNSCRYCKGTGVSWISSVLVHETGELEDIRIACSHCSEPLKEDEDE